MINPHIFRAYDIRGLYGSDLTGDSSYEIGRGVGTYFCRLHSNKIPTIVVGRDNRTHGEELKKSFIRGMLDCGINVVDIGEVPSPLMYFSVSFGKFDGGVNITASHNPKEYNGYKVVSEMAHSVCGEELQKIREIIEQNTFSAGTGTVDKKSFFNEYKAEIKEKIRLKKKIKVVIDAANGIAGSFYPEILEAIGCEVIKLFCESDGNFPNHEPDPIVEKNLEALVEKVKINNADLGIAFDGDGDRVGVIDELGNFHDANQLLILLAQDISTRNKTTVIYTVSCSSTIAEEVEKVGSKTVMVPVGHSYVETAMREHNALLGGEQSGHFFIAENYYPFDDACFTAANIIRIASNSENPFSEIFKKMPRTYQTAEIRPDCPDNIKFELINRITEQLSKEYKCNTMDGVRIEFPNGGWASVRASNTSPKLSICTEARSPDELKEIDELIWRVLKEHKIMHP